MQVHTQMQVQTEIKATRIANQRSRWISRVKSKVELQRILSQLISHHSTSFLTSIFYPAIEKSYQKNINNENIAPFINYYYIINIWLTFLFLQGSIFLRKFGTFIGVNYHAQPTTMSAINSTTGCFPFPKFNDKSDNVSNVDTACT